MKNPKRTWAAGFLALLACVAFRAILRVEAISRYEESCLFLLAFLNANELLKE